MKKSSGKLVSAVFAAVLGLLALRDNYRAIKLDRSAELSSCASESWDAPRSLSDRASGVISEASLAASRERFAIVGIPVSHDNLMDAAADLDVRWLNGPSVGRPVGSFVFVNPVASLVGESSIVLVWGEPEPAAHVVPVEALRMGMIDALWTSTYSPETGWTPAKRIFKGRVKWSRESADVSVEGKSVLLAVPSFDRHEVLLLQNNDEAWQALRLTAPGLVAYASVAQSGRSVSILYHSLADKEEDNGIYAQSSTDRAATWSTPALFATDNSPNPSLLRVRATGADRFHAIWAPLRGDGRRVIRHRLLGNSAAAQGEDDETLTFPSVLRLEASAGPCDRVHVAVVGMSSSKPEPALRYEMWDRSWHSTSQPQLGRVVADAFIAVTGIGRVGIVGLATSGNADDPSEFVTLFTSK